MKRVKYKVKVKSKVEIKGENVRLISQDRVQRLDPPLLSRPDRGRPTDIWLVGPYGSAI
jgi:hypothetical protein